MNHFITLSIINDFVGENPTVWSWLSFIVEIFIAGAIANYGVVWLYDRMGWNKKRRKKEK